MISTLLRFVGKGPPAPPRAPLHRWRATPWQEHSPPTIAVPDVTRGEKQTASLREMQLFPSRFMDLPVLEASSRSPLAPPLGKGLNNLPGQCKKFPRRETSGTPGPGSLRAGHGREDQLPRRRGRTGRSGSSDAFRHAFRGRTGRIAERKAVPGAISSGG